MKWLGLELTLKVGRLRLQGRILKKEKALNKIFSMLPNSQAEMEMEMDIQILCYPLMWKEQYLRNWKETQLQAMIHQIWQQWIKVHTIKLLAQVLDMHPKRDTMPHLIIVILLEPSLVREHLLSLKKEVLQTWLTINNTSQIVVSFFQGKTILVKLVWTLIVIYTYQGKFLNSRRRHSILSSNKLKRFPMEFQYLPMFKALIQLSILSKQF